MSVSIRPHPERVDLQLRPARLPTILGIASANSGSADEAGSKVLILSVAAQLRRTGKEMTLRIGRRDEFPARPNPSLIKLIVRAHLFQAKLLQSGGGKFAELAKREKLNRPYFARILRPTYLAPDITHAILDGRQPPNLSTAALLGTPPATMTPSRPGSVEIELAGTVIRATPGVDWRHLRDVLRAVKAAM